MGNIDQVRGGKLKTMRATARLSQKQVADHFDIDKSAVSEWERGLGKPTLDKLRRLDSLYGGTGAVLDLFEVGAVTARASSGDSTGGMLRLTKLVDQLEKRVAALESRSVSPRRSATR